MVVCSRTPTVVLVALVVGCSAFGCREVTTEPVRGRPPPDVDPAALCDQFCEATGSCYDDCTAACQSYQAPPCTNEGLAFADCLVDFYDPTLCTGNGECGWEQIAYFDCRRTVPPKCEPEVCVGDDSACTCSRDCDGGRQTATCVVQGNIASCTCYLDALVVADATHFAAPAMELCSLSTGQCAVALGGEP